MEKTSKLLAVIALGLILLGAGFIEVVSAPTITGTPDDTAGVWLFSAGTNTEAGGQPTDEIVGNAVAAGIITYIGDEDDEVVNFHDGLPEPYEEPRDDTEPLVWEGLEAIDDFGLIEEPSDPASNFDAGIGGWVLLGGFGKIRPDGVVASGTIGPETGIDPEEALGGFEIFIFEDAELSGFTCTLTPNTGGPINFVIDDRQVDPTTPNGADDTLIAIDLDSLEGFTGEYITSITITDDSISMTGELFGDTTLELDAVATRVSVVTGSISGYKWNDYNGNGVKDPGEPYLTGWEIKLSGDAVDTVYTNSLGRFKFNGLVAGTYTVSETLQPDWEQTWPLPIPPGSYTINLGPGENATGYTFGNKLPPGSISGYKWNDTNRDGVKDPGEPGLGGWEIKLSGDATATTTTAPNGFYIFTGLTAGSYTVSETHEPGWVQSFPTAPGTHSITLAAGEDSTDNNFGNYLSPPSVGGWGEIIAATSTNYLLIILAISLMGALSYGITRKIKT